MIFICRIVILVMISTTSTTLLGREDQIRIINGKVIDIRDVPYQVYFADFCGGAILSKRVIATAAHCIESEKKYNFIRAGSSNPLCGGQNKKVTKSIRHPKFGESSIGSYDFGALILEEDLIFNDFVKAIDLAREPAIDGTTLSVSGWGVSEKGYMDGKLRAANVNQIDFNLCQKNYSKVEDEEYVLDQSMICAGFLDGGVDSCFGDSGGPLVFNNTLYGIVSFGNGCGDPSFPGVYGSIPVVYDWYMNFIRNDFSH